MSRFPHPVAVVTGGARGIGLAIVRRLAADGHAVVIADRDRRAGRAAVGAIAGTVLFQPADVADEASVRALMRLAVARFGRLDALVNNAGIAAAGTGRCERLRRRDWDRLLAVNLTGAFLCAKHAIPALRRARGAIVNIASTRAVQSEPDTEAYAASKGGLLALTHALAVSLGPDIRVNAISPGWIDTRDAPLRPADHAQHPAGRVGRPEDVAELAAYLLSPRAGFTTGQNHVIDGGITVRMRYLE